MSVPIAISVGVTLYLVVVFFALPWMWPHQAVRLARVLAADLPEFGIVARWYEDYVSKYFGPRFLSEMMRFSRGQEVTIKDYDHRTPFDGRIGRVLDFDPDLPLVKVDWGSFVDWMFVEDIEPNQSQSPATPDSEMGEFK